MKKLTALVVVTCLALSGCTESKPPAQDTVSEVNSSTSTTKLNSSPKGVVTENGTTYISKEGLTISVSPPTEGPAKVAWDYFRLRGEQKYEDALLLLDGSDTNDKYKIWAEYSSKSGEPYLKEVIGSSFVRWADITDVAAKESEDNDAIEYKIIYMEMNFKLRGKLTEKQTDMRNGLNRYAVHVVRYKEDGPWRISLLGGAPWLEK